MNKLDFNNIVDFDLKEIIDYILIMNINNVDIDDLEVGKLDKFIVENLTRGFAILSKDKVLKVGLLIVHSLRLITDKKLSKNYSDRWEVLSELCAEFLDSNSTDLTYKNLISSLDELNKLGFSFYILDMLYHSKVLTFQELEDVLFNKKHVLELISKLEKLNILHVSTTGKNNLISLTSLGMNVYRTILFDKNML